MAISMLQAMIDAGTSFSDAEPEFTLPLIFQISPPIRVMFPPRTL